MKKEIIAKLTKSFENSAHEEQGIEFWMARDIQELLEYDRWSNFLNVVEKAKIACKNSTHIIENHFADVGKMVRLGSGSDREIPDMMLSRYACYLIAQNGDPRKESVAFAQTYFALQTRKQELLEKRLEMVERLEARQKLTQTEKELSTTLYEHGVDDQGFARIRSKGDQALFGGFTTIQMNRRLALKMFSSRWKQRRSIHRTFCSSEACTRSSRASPSHSVLKTLVVSSKWAPRSMPL